MSRSFGHLSRAVSPRDVDPLLSFVLCVDSCVVSHAVGPHIRPSSRDTLTLLNEAAGDGKRKKKEEEK